MKPIMRFFCVSVYIVVEGSDDHKGTNEVYFHNNSSACFQCAELVMYNSRIYVYILAYTE